MSYKLYRTEDVGVPLDHHAIFVETATDGSGRLFQVTGNIQEGMKYECEGGKKPEMSLSFVDKVFLGQVATTNWDRFGEICSSIPPPKQQFAGPKRLYPKEPLRRCQEWTQEAILALTDAGLFQTTDSTVHNETG
ncbi:MAG: hypothetical protein M1825_002363 [Sarcosagium campestre]|nr:MAG: hypothetical protein M1825_002363 [Sarcosagium campestre]